MRRNKEGKKEKDAGGRDSERKVEEENGGKGACKRRIEKFKWTD
jgi:hypothetical protein